MMQRVFNALGLTFFLLALLCASARSQEVRRPTVETTTAVSHRFCSGTWQSGTLPNFWDSGGNSTSSTQSSGGSRSVNNVYKASTISGFTAASGSYSSLSLKIDWACTAISETTIGGCQISYSTDNGSSWNTAETVNTVAGVQHVTTVSLSSSQDITQLQVKWEACGSWDEVGLVSTIVGYDIRTEGTLAQKKKFQVIATE